MIRRKRRGSLGEIKRSRKKTRRASKMSHNAAHDAHVGKLHYEITRNWGKGPDYRAEICTYKGSQHRVRLRGSKWPLEKYSSPAQGKSRCASALSQTPTRALKRAMSALAKKLT